MTVKICYNVVLPNKQLQNFLKILFVLVDFSYIEPRHAKKHASQNDIESCSYSEWKQMRPPRHFTDDYHSLVSAREIDLVRALLRGKTALKWDLKEHSTSGYVKERPVRRFTCDQEIQISPSIVKSCIKYTQNQMYKN